MARVLVVEDDPTLEHTYNLLLAKEGHIVDRAADGEEALKSAEENEPDLILLDLLMPNVNGVEFLRRYDIKGKHPNVKVIVFTNLSMDSTIDEVMKLGATRYVVKASTSPKELASIILQTLGGSSSSAEESPKPTSENG
jgi:DNA-binding response OmpR family regulator